MKKATRPEQGLGLTYSGGRPRDEDVLTRRRLSLWDRSKWLVLLVVIWLLLVWSLMANNPLMGFLDAAKIEVQIGWWVFILIGLSLRGVLQRLAGLAQEGVECEREPTGLPRSKQAARTRCKSGTAGPIIPDADQSHGGSKIQ